MTADDRPLGIEARPGAPLPERMRAAQAPTRGPVYGARYAVAAEHPAAAIAALDVLRSGGSAVDATIAASAVNVVTKPYATHLGGDAFALIWHRDTNAVECLNAGGLAPRRATLQEFASGIPGGGPRASTVPGLVDSWAALHASHGTRALSELLRPAIELAEEGFPVSTFLAVQMAALAKADRPAMPIRTLFLKDGERAYRRGETLRQPELAGTLARIGADGRDGFYGGRTGEAIVRAIRESGGLIDEADFAEPLAHWQEPLSTAYRDCTVYEQALPSQGIILLMALNIVERFPLGEWGVASADAVHVMSEAIRLAFQDARRYLGDPFVEDVPVDRLLSNEYAAERAAQIDLSRAREYSAAPAGADTTSFVVADETTAVCFIQSIYSIWGSGFAIPSVGVLMNDRLRAFSTDPASPNCIAPGKRAVHTLNNFLVLRDGQLVAGGGTPGANFQVQTNLQTVAGVVDWRLDLHSAINAPRWGYTDGGLLAMESRVPPDVIDSIEARGHRVQRIGPWETALSRSQVVGSLPDGGWAAASDLRSEGLALAV